jgi:hypothetical protein
MSQALGGALRDVRRELVGLFLEGCVKEVAVNKRIKDRPQCAAGEQTENIVDVLKPVNCGVRGDHSIPSRVSKNKT